jgi:hypothetical protein
MLNQISRLIDIGDRALFQPSMLVDVAIFVLSLSISYLAVTYGLVSVFVVLYPICVSVYLYKVGQHSFQQYEELASKTPSALPLRKFWTPIAVKYCSLFLFPILLVAYLLIYSDKWALPQYVGWRTKVLEANQSFRDWFAEVHPFPWHPFPLLPEQNQSDQAYILAYMFVFISALLALVLLLAMIRLYFKAARADLRAKSKGKVFLALVRPMLVFAFFGYFLLTSQTMGIYLDPKKTPQKVELNSGYLTVKSSQSLSGNSTYYVEDGALIYSRTLLEFCLTYLLLVPLLIPMHSGFLLAALSVISTREPSRREE